MVLRTLFEMFRLPAMKENVYSKKGTFIQVILKELNSHEYLSNGNKSSQSCGCIMPETVDHVQFIYPWSVELIMCGVENMI